MKTIKRDEEQRCRVASGKRNIPGCNNRLRRHGHASPSFVVVATESSTVCVQTVYIARVFSLGLVQNFSGSRKVSGKSRGGA